ncbi:HAMP domain-containing histidine kinase [Paracrocinitomix mangrovi]|uniref:sensor histidine kinase n=1 Tax=Paracrocinitomix mangrovi TaxID=2862509 RepID=UPI001C8DEDBF|nr:HAMP domain-containing sensor histidine kinase [Paracrocinitomix mangrovi]UKN03060.1 HAMP domain-containing histidine kinase [Paracrocinitomix mangrovi]
MSVALVGLLLLQFFWIRNVHYLAEEQFQEDVNQCLEKTSSDLEHAETVNLMEPDLYKRGLQGSYTDFVRSEFGEVMSAQEAIQVRDTIIVKDGEPMRFLVVMGTTIDTATGLRAEHRVITKNYGEIAPTDIENSVLGISDTNSFAIQLNRSFERQIMNKADYLNKLMVNIFTNNIFDDIALRVDPRYLDSVLAKNLSVKKIDTLFTFNVVDRNYESVEFFIKSPHLDPDLTSSQYNTLLFPSDIVSGDYQLLISFPKERLYVWKNMAGTLVGSLLLVLIVVFAFYFAVSTIYKQKQLSEIKNDFISNMTHELKTPISTISLACEAAKDPDVGADQETIQSFIGMIDQENKRLGKLVENVLQTALIDKGKLKLNLESNRLDLLVKEVVNNFQIRFKDRGGRIEIDQLDEVEWLSDKIHFSNVIYNLLDNSLKYCDGSPLVKISLKAVDEKVEIIVEDNGIGIKKEDQKRIFEKLYRVPTGDVHNVKGFGLGLSYVHAIVDLHHGVIDLESEEGVGSTFKITLKND